MALNTFSLVKAAVPSRIDVLTAQLNPTGADLEDLMLQAEERIYDDLMAHGGVRNWETALSLTITGTGTIAVPTDYLELKHAYIDQANAQWLERKSAEWVYRAYPKRSADGLPKTIAREGSNFIFGPYADSQYLVKGIYYGKPTSVVGSASTFTGIFADHPLLLLFAGCVEAEQFIKRPDQIQLWESRYQQELERVIGKEMRERWSGSSLRVTTA